MRKVLETKFKCSLPGNIVAAKYRRDTNTFLGLVQYKTIHPRTERETVFKEEVVLDEWWVRNTFDEGHVTHIINMDSKDGFLPVPNTDKTVLVFQKPVTRVKFVPASTRMVIDTEAKQKWNARIVRRDKKRQPILPSKEEPPLKEVPVSEYWMVMFADKQTAHVKEDFIVKSFGQLYTDEVKKTKRGYVDVPVGESKTSRLHLFPHLSIPGAPRINFTQEAEKDLCVSKSLASVLHALGFVTESFEIDSFGEQRLSGNVMDSISKLAKFAQSCLPSWLQMKIMPSGFKWNDASLFERKTILLSVLVADDGHQNHAFNHPLWIHL